MAKFNMAKIDIQNIGFHLILYAPQNKKETIFNRLFIRYAQDVSITAILNFKLVYALAHCYETCYLYVIFE